MPNHIWWEHIIKANSFLKSICDEALKNKSMVLEMPDFVPWRDTFEEMIKEKLHIESSNRIIQEFECPDTEPGAYLFNRYCSPDVRARYRHGKGYARFLGECQKTVLHDRYLWIKNIPEEKIEEWIQFILSYNSYIEGKTPAVFILEVKGELNKGIKGISVLSYNHEISNYDRYAFTALLASQTKCKEYIRPYLAEVISSICDQDVELCAACVSKGMNILNDFYKQIRKIVEKEYRSDGVHYYFNKPKEVVDQLIWETQLKYVFPLIENYRKYFIQKYETSIRLSLPFQNGIGETIDSPEDVEIGTLKYMVDIGKISASLDHKDLCLYRDARNDLAHMKVLENDILFQILGKGKY